MDRYVSVTTRDDLSTLFSPDAGMRVLFLYDPYCPTNWVARDELEQAAEEISIVDVSAHPELTRPIEDLTGVKHQSPQVFVLVGGGVAWHGSHGSIRAEHVKASLAGVA